MEIHERLARLEADEKNIFHQLSEIKDEVKDIRRLTAAVEKIAVKTESIDSKVDDMGSRISAVENEPAQSYNHYKKLVAGSTLTAIVSAICAAILALIMKG
ncbi:MAG: hypothetical protein UHH95_01355 [Oscillospiraceae bacterium]|nr:hypothetical protein [Oscillospiraceae bacterium]